MRTRHSLKNIEHILDIGGTEYEEINVQLDENASIETQIRQLVSLGNATIKALVKTLEEDVTLGTAEVISELINTSVGALEKIAKIEQIRANIKKTDALTQKINRENEGNQLPQNGGVNINNAIFCGKLSDIIDKKNELQSKRENEIVIAVENNGITEK